MQAVRGLNFANGYNGQGDPLLFFGGDGDTLGEDPSDVFSINIKNTYPTKKVIALVSGRQNTVAKLASLGIAVDAILTDGDFLIDGVDPTKKLNGASGDPSKTIEFFKDYVIDTPTSIPIVKFDWDPSSAQKNEVFTTTRIPLTKSNEAKRYPLATFMPADQLNQQAAEIRFSVAEQLDQYTVVTLGIAAGAQVTVNWFIGAMASLGAYLQNRTQLARANRQMR